MKNIEIKVNEQLLKQLNSLAVLRNKSFDEIVAQTLEHGLKDICYRMRRNQQKWQEQKALQEKIKELEAKLKEEV